MEDIHGVDVSWLHNTHNKNKPTSTTKQSSPLVVENVKRPETNTTSKAGQNGQSQDSKEQSFGSTPRPIPTRPGFMRTASSDRKDSVGIKTTSASAGISRRNSWLSSIKSSFGSSPSPQSGGNSVNGFPAPVNSQPDPRAPVGSPAKNAVLPPATQPVGAAPYTPAPPRQQQAGFLQSALRRLSSSSGAQMDKNTLKVQHGLCARQVLNVDHQRERCQCPGLQQSKLRRVAFCVDVEIASGPKYTEDASEGSKDDKEKTAVKKMVEKSEGEALKHPEKVAQQKTDLGIIQASGDGFTIEAAPPGMIEGASVPSSEEKALTDPGTSETAERDTTKKKEKKKRSEEERKARKEKKRRQAEANGTLPVELVRNASDSSLEAVPHKGAPRTQASPTTDPARIYRRCCQLRETPILKKITEQLGAPVNCDQHGVVTKLDLSGYWMQSTDLVTLGDFLAVVPVKELMMEGCGLTDEGVRVVLAGLLAARSPQAPGKRRYRSIKSVEAMHHEGVIERVILKNNVNIGRDGWRHVCLFIHMCRSIKSIDVSMNQFPQPLVSGDTARQPTREVKDQVDIANLLSQALEKRLAGPDLELLNIAETGITTQQLGLVIDGIIKSGLCRLGLAGNHITEEGVAHIARYVKEGRCEGLDLGGNDLKGHLGTLAEAMNKNHPLWALSLNSCNLTPDDLYKIFPTLTKLSNFRFIDLSHNHDLFSDPRHSALSIIQKLLPKMPILKRIHLTDVSMTPEQAVALAEVFAESSSLAHVNLLSNPEISILASATDEANQEEACALYASLMAAVRVSSSLICIDIDVPSNDSSEIVKALAKQVVAYCLRNMERGPVAEIAGAVAQLTGSDEGDEEVAVPDVLMHLVGGDADQPHDDELAPDDDYVIGGTGLVKALGICLRNSATGSRRPSNDRTYSDWSDSGTTTPRPQVAGGKAKDMSKNLLGSARNIRARLQPALIKEARAGSDRVTYQRLLFLDQTLENMIRRFEAEYPETRLPPRSDAMFTLDPENASPSETSILSNTETHFLASDTETAPGAVSDDESHLHAPPISRHNSDISLAARTLATEEGQMHRIGQQFRRDILKPEVDDTPRGTTGKEVWAPHIQMLRATIEEMGGEEIRERVRQGGQNAVLKELSEEASVVRQMIIESDPEGWEFFKQAQERMVRNSRVEGMDENYSAVE